MHVNPSCVSPSDHRPSTLLLLHPLISSLTDYPPSPHSVVGRLSPPCCSTLSQWSMPGCCMHAFDPLYCVDSVLELEMSVGIFGQREFSGENCITAKSCDMKSTGFQALIRRYSRYALIQPPENAETTRTAFKAPYSLMHLD